jgi:hypothetical protein
VQCPDSSFPSVVCLHDHETLKGLKTSHSPGYRRVGLFVTQNIEDPLGVDEGSGFEMAKKSSLTQNLRWTD